MRWHYHYTFWIYFFFKGIFKAFIIIGAYRRGCHKIVLLQNPCILMCMTLHLRQTSGGIYLTESHLAAQSQCCQELNGKNTVFYKVASNHVKHLSMFDSGVFRENIVQQRITLHLRRTSGGQLYSSGNL